MHPCAQDAFCTWSLQHAAMQLTGCLLAVRLYRHEHKLDAAATEHVSWQLKHDTPTAAGPGHWQTAWCWSAGARIPDALPTGQDQYAFLGPVLPDSVVKDIAEGELAQASTQWPWWSCVCLSCCHQHCLTLL